MDYYKRIVHRNCLTLLVAWVVILAPVSVSGFTHSTELRKPVLRSELRSKPAKVGEEVVYSFELHNTENRSLSFTLAVAHPELLACPTQLSDTVIELAAGALYQGQVRVVLDERVPIGGQESCVLQAIVPTEGQSYQLEFTTVRKMLHPFLLVSQEVLEEAKVKLKDHAWAQQNLAALLSQLDKVQFPERKIVTKPRPVKVWSSLSYRANDGKNAFLLSLAWALTGNTDYRDKVIHFIREVCDPKAGYLSVGAATTGVQVHEGAFFLYLAASCDLLYSESVLREEDKQNIEATLRLYLKQNREHMSAIGIMNHQASANAGAIIAALFLQDMVEVEHLIEGAGGMADQISRGVMADGWWFEGTANYCYLVAQRYMLVAQAFDNYGWDLYHRRFPVRYKSQDFENAKAGFTGMKFDIWGPSGKNTRGVEDMVSPYIPMMDEDANVVSNNDSNLKPPDEYYELAYRKYQNRDLAWVLSKSTRSSWLSLVYGIAELPEVPDPRTNSAFIPNVGLVALRSQKTLQKPTEQIQAYFKYGTHGGWHGHFDRTGMIALDRNGYKYFGTEMAWFGYGHPGYKECVQTSATHNMVVLDGLQQEAVPSRQLLFHSGELMQVSVLQTKARWRKIPTFNKALFPPWDDKEFAPDVTPVLQRRVAVVTKDFVVIGDYLKAAQTHDYDCLYHPIGFQAIHGAKETGPLLDTLETDRESPYRYFTNGQWYTYNQGAKVEFNDQGNKLGIHTLWPQSAKAFTASYPSGGKPRGIRNNPNRGTYGVRTTGKEVYFLTVLEPYQGESKIQKIESTAPEELSVYLTDGSRQKISISHLNGVEHEIQVHIEEKLKNGQLRYESTPKLSN
ncbi:MAG: alginate lyase family protein [Saprospiraceae bacterium]|nr:alginate lyase family protein [Saprospiraceae bacterium]